MSEHIMSIEAGKTRVLHTAGQYCDRDIVIEAQDSDYDEAYNAGVTDGIEQGKKAEYDAFWDAYQDSGNRADYDFAFAGNGWTDATFKPKHDIVITGRTDSMFQGCLISDLVKILNDCGVVFDMSHSIESAYFASTSPNLTTLPVLDCRGRESINYFISSCAKLHTIEKVILKEDGSQKFNDYSFNRLSGLKEIRFAGCIGSSLKIKNSPLLSDGSVQSIIDCLKDLTGATAQTLTLHATVGGKMTPEQKAAITAKNWTLVY
jgi:hypothetical protein